MTSEYLTALRHTPAPRVRFLLALAATFAFALWACAAFLARWTAQESHRTLAVASLGPSTRVLILGSSHVFGSIDPAQLRVPSMNLAAPVCSYVCAEGILRGNLARVPALEALVIEFDVVPAFYDTLRAYQGDYRQLLELQPDVFAMDVSAADRYALWRDQSLDQSFLGPLFRFGKLTPQEIANRLRGGREHEDIVGPGYESGNESMPAEDDGPARVQRHVREAGGLSELPRNEAALRRMLALGSSRGLKLALLRLPHHPGYWRALPPAWEQAMAELLGRLERDFPGGFEYMDYGTLAALGDADYRNGDHLNDRAARRFTALFGERLEQWLAEPSTSSAR